MKTLARGSLLAAHMDSAMHPGALYGGHELRSRQSRHNARRALHVLVASFAGVAALLAAMQ